MEENNNNGNERNSCLPSMATATSTIQDVESISSPASLSTPKSTPTETPSNKSHVAPSPVRPMPSLSTPPPHDRVVKTKSVKALSYADNPTIVEGIMTVHRSLHNRPMRSPLASASPAPPFKPRAPESSASTPKISPLAYALRNPTSRAGESEEVNKAREEAARLRAEDKNQVSHPRSVPPECDVLSSSHSEISHHVPYALRSRESRIGGKFKRAEVPDREKRSGARDTTQKSHVSINVDSQDASRTTVNNSSDQSRENIPAHSLLQYPLPAAAPRYSTRSQDYLRTRYEPSPEEMRRLRARAVRENIKKAIRVTLYLVAMVLGFGGFPLVIIGYTLVICLDKEEEYDNWEICSVPFLLVVRQMAVVGFAAGLITLLVILGIEVARRRMWRLG